jgi:membrane-bound serine protease (ClpP class)
MNRTFPALPLLAAMLLLAAVVPARAAVHRAVLDGPVDPLHAEYLVRAIDQAEAEDSDLVLVVINTPGGLVDSMEVIVRRMLAATVPVAAYVAPSGGRAASAGFFLLVSADVAAMAPGTRTGAAHPILSIGGILPIDPGQLPGTEPQKTPVPTPAPPGTDDQPVQDGDGTPATAPAPRTPPTTQSAILMEKISSDIQAYLRAITAVRGRNAEAAALAVSESRAYTEQEALELRLIDVIAATEADLLRQLDGREVRRIDGTTQVLSVAGAPVVDIPMTFRERALSFLVNPNVAFLLFLLGLLLVYVEVTHTGMVLPGVIGGLCLLLAVTGFSFLPVTAAGVLLILAAIGLFVAEVFIQSFGVLALAGVVSLALGAIMLVDLPEGGMRVDPTLAITTAVAFGGIVMFLTLLAIRSMRRSVVTGSEGLVGETGTAVTDVGPTGGKVQVHGEYWNARSGTPLAAGTPVRVRTVDGLTLDVAPVDGDLPGPVAPM